MRPGRPRTEVRGRLFAGNWINPAKETASFCEKWKNFQKWKKKDSFYRNT
jgi:hypothetical protein